MIDRTQRVRLEVEKTSPQRRTIQFKQGDINSNILDIAIRKDLVIQDISEYDILITFDKVLTISNITDRQYFEITNNSIKVTVPNQVTQDVVEGKLEIVIFKENYVLKTQILKYRVEESLEPFLGEIEEPTNILLDILYDLEQLQQLIQEKQDKIEVEPTWENLDKLLKGEL